MRLIRRVFHTVNILLHMAAAVLVYWILLRCTGWPVAAFAGAPDFRGASDAGGERGMGVGDERCSGGGVGAGGD